MKKKNNLQKYINLCLLAVLFLSLLIPFWRTKAQEGTTFTPQVGIPGSDFRAGEVLGITGRSFIDYLVAFYQWAVGAIAILAVVMIMVAGFQWMAAAGNAALIGKAKNRISNSLVGLLLAVGAYSLLNFINPSLVDLRTLDLDPIEYMPLFTSEVSCQNGYITYNWSGHYCYDMPGYNTLETKYYPIDDFVNSDDLLQDPELMRGAEVKLDLGVHGDRIAYCDAQNNFDRFTKSGSRVNTAEDVLLSYDPDKQITYSLLTSDKALFVSETGSINVSLDYDDYIDIFGVGTPLLKGLRVSYQGREDKNLASSYVKDIVIQTKKWCAICCKKEDIDRVDFAPRNECPDGWEATNFSECCERYAAKKCSELTPTQCGGVEKFCGARCRWWSDVGANGTCGTLE